MKDARCGWQSKLPAFIVASNRDIEDALSRFVQSPSASQLGAWRESIKWLKREYDHCVREDSNAATYSTVLEYELPRDLRRPDVIVLQNGLVVVLEVKGRVGSSQAARDQVGAYARDLRAYHRACSDKDVIALLVPTDGPAEAKQIDDVWIVGPAGVHEFLLKICASKKSGVLHVEDFLQEDSYAPLPTIVQAARSLFHKKPLPRIKRATAATDPALDAITSIAHHAAATETRHLVFLRGLPGAGKTLVGLQLVHAGWLDDLAVDRGNKQSSIPGGYLSGNGPLVEVLQDALKGEGVSGKTFVQGLKSYIKFYLSRRNVSPPEHLIVFDEAQRAWDLEKVISRQGVSGAKSEPALLLEFCERIPEWSVLVALIGDGQAIHQGEEGGMPMWRSALDAHPDASCWKVHSPKEFANEFVDTSYSVEWDDALNLDTEIRFHLTPNVHRFVEAILDGGSVSKSREISDLLWEGGYRFLLTRDFEVAKQYMRERYEGAPEARFGVLASSKDKILEKHGIDNTFQTTKRLKVGPWFNRPVDDELSCCQLQTVATEFSSQGLELDFALIGWGSDLIWAESSWSMRCSKGTRGHVEDPMQLRKNVYRVLLTRGRDGAVVFVPPTDLLDSTYAHLVSAGFRELGE